MPDSVNQQFGNDIVESNLVVEAGANGEAGNYQPPPPPQASQTQATGATVQSSETGSVFGIPMSDYLYQSGVTIPDAQYTNNTLKVGLDALGLAQNNSSIVNDAGNGESSILINSDRVIINSRSSHTIIAGADGVALTSPTKVNIDADESVTIFGAEGIYLGVPNKGKQPEAFPPADLTANIDAFVDKTTGKKLKSYPSQDAPYEPMVLGLKLVNWLDDLLVIIKNMQILTNTGLATPREDAQWDFIALQERLKELVSDYIYIDGFSHEKMDYKGVASPPAKVTTPKTSIDVNANVTYLQGGAAPSPGPVASANSTKPGYYESGNAPIPTIKN